MAYSQFMQDMALAGASGGTSSLIDIAQGKLPGSSACGGKNKPKPWAKTPGGKVGYKGQKLLDAYNYLMPGTMDVVGRSAAGYGDIYRTEADKTRAYELASFKELGPQYVEAITAADPLRAKTREIIMGNLDKGLDPSVAREIQQGSRAAWSSRGLAESPASGIEELFNLGARGKDLEERNLNAAFRVTQSTDPWMAFAGRPSGPQGSNVNSPDYANFNNDLFSLQTNYDIQRNNNAQAAKARQAELIGAGIGAVGSIAGGAAGFI